MKIKTHFDGFDGTKSYEAGDTLEGNTEHNQRLLFNGIADPVDQEAKDLDKKYKSLNDDDYENHRLYSAEHEALSRQAKPKAKAKGKAKSKR